MASLITKQLFLVIVMTCLLECFLCADCPQSCSCVSSPPYFTVTCNSPNLTSVPSGVPRNCTGFVIRGTKVSALRNGDLAGLPNLNTIYFDNNQIFTVEVDAFVPSLTYIEMVQNEISALPAGVFGRLKKLTSLDMRWNRIKSIPKGCIKDLPLLQVVYLEGNGLESIEVGAFSNTSKLTVISLEDNSITEIRKGAFLGPQAKMANVGLARNAISHIDEGAFAVFGNLGGLGLANNSLKSVEGAFSGLKAVGGLDLSYNKLQSLSDAAFSGITEMSTLNLAFNEIEVIFGKTFASLSTLTVLGLQSNKLASFDVVLPNTLTTLELQNNLLTSFPNLPTSLTYLDISSNPIEFMADKQFAKLGSLTTLCLSNIRYFRQKGTIDAGILQGLSQLTTLKLASNNLTQVPSSALQHFPQMSETLDLSDNQITSLHPGDFTNLSNLYILILKGNNITSVSPDALKPLKGLFSLDLSHNPIVYLGPDLFKWQSQSMYEVKLEGTKLRLIDGDIFNSSTGMKSLFFENNDMRYLPWNVFNPLTYYGETLSFIFRDLSPVGDPQEALDLESNPWLCDCQMYEYARWQNSTQGIVAASLTCQDPPELRNKTLREIPLEQFKCICSHFSTPSIDTTGSDANATSGQGAVLKCNVTACPEAVILWSTPRGITLANNSPHPGLEVLDDGSLVIVETVPADTGTYSCMAANYLGQTTAYLRLEVIPSSRLP
ncbi:PREDICTED: leucine-rich repeat-containing protein 15-like [Branchiostoma belcheri]|uniref:Leucine-rich repeat-containing protein 15-like n=1 Tax=Branchiostoma belcheri TaxID=7741 RepID=A0A6P4Y613_BRABE|nr:PREDICTED: leucine-rich repeat-containing protein 15-like [Branchiostoma belcheri]